MTIKPCSRQIFAISFRLAPDITAVVGFWMVGVQYRAVILFVRQASSRASGSSPSSSISKPSTLMPNSCAALISPG